MEAQPQTPQQDLHAGAHGGSGQMFDRIAARYDLLNRLISLGLDKSWRRKMVAALAVDGDGAGQEVLDVATGTADVALAIAQTHPKAHVVGLDPSVGMLEVGHRKVEDLTMKERVELVEGDAQAMDFEDDRFVGACISFGIRNVPDRLKGLREMTRVVKPGGKVVILELTEPRQGLLAPFARFHVHHVVPTLGAILSGSWEYRYLQRSIAAFPSPEQFAEIMTEAGLRDVTFEAMSFHAAHLYVGTVA